MEKKMTGFFFLFC